MKSLVDLPAVVLESHVTSVYADTLGSYELPRRYLKYFDAASYGSPILAVIYEPRGEDTPGGWHTSAGRG